MPDAYDVDSWSLDAVDDLETVTLKIREAYNPGNGEELQWRHTTSGIILMDIQPSSSHLKVLPPAMRDVITHVAFCAVNAAIKVGTEIITEPGVTYFVESVNDWSSHYMLFLRTTK